MITIVDYGMGNLGSVLNMFKHIENNNLIMTKAFNTLSYEDMNNGWFKFESVSKTIYTNTLIYEENTYIRTIPGHSSNYTQSNEDWLRQNKLIGFKVLGCTDIIEIEMITR